MTNIDIADAESQLSQLVETVENGETVYVMRNGKRIAQLIATTASKKRPIDIALLRSVTASIPSSKDNIGALIRALRDGNRY